MFTSTKLDKEEQKRLSTWRETLKHELEKMNNLLLQKESALEQ